MWGASAFMRHHANAIEAATATNIGVPEFTIPRWLCIGDRGDVVTRFILLLSEDAYAMQLCKQGLKIGEGAGIVYAYGYRCCQDRIKFGSTDVDTVERIAQQINMSTPDKPVLLIEIRTDKRRALERARPPWRHWVAKSRVAARNGSWQTGTTFWRSINSSNSHSTNGSRSRDLRHSRGPRFQWLASLQSDRTTAQITRSD